MLPHLSDYGRGAGGVCTNWEGSGESGHDQRPTAVIIHRTLHH